MEAGSLITASLQRRCHCPHHAQHNHIIHDPSSEQKERSPSCLHRACWGSHQNSISLACPSIYIALDTDWLFFLFFLFYLFFLFSFFSFFSTYESSYVHVTSDGFILFEYLVLMNEWIHSPTRLGVPHESWKFQTSVNVPRLRQI